MQLLQWLTVLILATFAGSLVSKIVLRLADVPVYLAFLFGGIACVTLASQPELVGILQGTITAAAVINEIIAVIAAKKGFEPAAPPFR